MAMTVIKQRKVAYKAKTNLSPGALLFQVAKAVANSFGDAGGSRLLGVSR